MPRGGKREKAGRKTTWESGVKFEETSPIRVPNHIKDKLLEIAHRLDAGEDFDSVSNSNKHRLQELELENQRLFEQVKTYHLDLETKSKEFLLRIQELEQENSHLQSEKVQNLQKELVTKSNKSVTKSKSYTQSGLFELEVNENVQDLKPLTAVELSKRFNRHESFVRKKKHELKNKLDELVLVLKQSDPQNIGWRYSEEDKKYHPILENQDLRTGSD